MTTAPEICLSRPLENSYLALPAVFYAEVAPTPVANPQLVIYNEALAQSLGLPALSAAEQAAWLAGNRQAAGSPPLALAYAGHQFGHFTKLGDGRAHLLGEVLAQSGQRFDIQLKGSGPTPYARRGDGRAALGPMLREYLISEAMAALGIPTTRSLAVVTTGEVVQRATPQRGAVLARVAASHLRVGTFEWAAQTQDQAALRALLDYAIARHDPELAGQANPALALLGAVIARQAKLVAAWLCVGFVHGVMNTDNMTISGETIDYGPCAFLDRFALDTVFSSIDTAGRYAYGNQPHVAAWNLACLANTFLPLLHSTPATAQQLAADALEKFGEIFNAAWLSGMGRKLGLETAHAADLPLLQDFLAWLQASGADYTRTLLELAEPTRPAREIYQHPYFAPLHTRWLARLGVGTQNEADGAWQAAQARMQAHNPRVIPRNHHVEAALRAAEQGEFAPFRELLAAVQQPFSQASSSHFAEPPTTPDPHYQTFCGT